MKPTTSRSIRPLRRARAYTLSALSLLTFVSGPASLGSALAQSVPVQPAAPPPAAAASGAPVTLTPVAKGKPVGKPVAKVPIAKTVTGPKALVAPPKSPVLSKAEAYQRAAPATVFLIAKDGNRFNTALGVVVKPNGVVVSDSRLVSGVEKGQVYAFLYDPSYAGDEDPLIFLRANQAKALPVQVVRMDAPNHLLMLQLPEPPPKQPYKSLDLFDMKSATTVGVDVIGLRTHGRQTLAMMTGTIMSVRPGAIETDPPLTLDHTGGPLLSANGRLLGIVTFADKSVDVAGVARPVELLHSLFTGMAGSAMAAPTNTSAEPAAESRNSVEAVRIALGNALAQKMDKRPALILHSEFIHSMALRGRVPLRDFESAEFVNTLIASLIKDSPAKAKVVAELFPLLITDKKGRAFRRDGTKYVMVPTSDFGVVTIDDANGMLFATDNKRHLIYYDAEGKSWRPTHLSPVMQVAVTGGTAYTILEDGRLMTSSFDGKDSLQLWPRLLKGGNLAASQGVMYLFDNDKIYRYRKGTWDNKLKPIAFSMQQMVVRGEGYYGLDLNGRVFSSVAQRYIDRDANIFKLWPIGRDLMVITKDNLRFYYSVEEDQWRPWTQW